MIFFYLLNDQYSKYCVAHYSKTRVEFVNYLKSRKANIQRYGSKNDLIEILSSCVYKLYGKDDWQQNLGYAYWNYDWPKTI
jgi:hypothetical protein